MSYRLENDVERSCHDPIEALSRYLSGRTEENYEKLRIAGVSTVFRTEHFSKRVTLAATWQQR
jgi:hypothetical protein